MIIMFIIMIDITIINIIIAIIINMILGITVSLLVSSLLLMVLVLWRSVFIISNRKTSNWASQILKANMLLICPYCLKFEIARV